MEDFEDTAELEAANRYHWGEDWPSEYPTLEYLKVAQPEDYASVTALARLISEQTLRARMETAEYFRGNGWQTDNAIDIYLDDIDGGDRYDRKH